MKKIPVSIFTTIEGHLSIAQAVEQCLSQAGLSPHINLEKGMEFALYAPVHLYFPKLQKITYKFSQTKKAKNLIKNYSKIVYQDKTIKALKRQRPKVAISCFCFYNSILDQANTHNNYLSLNIVSDPRSISPVIPSFTATNFVFDQQAVDYCLSLGIPKDKIVESGWFVRDEFEQPYDQKKIKQKLHLEPNTTTFLIVAGSDGTNTILKNIPTFLGPSKPLQVIVACGHNKKLFSYIKTFSKVISSLQKNNQVTITPLSFTKDIHLYLKAADLVIGKAGPNLLFESVATHTPFLATTHVSGVEDGNLELIHQYNLGLVEENPIKAAKLIKKLAKTPNILKQFTPSLKKLAKKNSLSKKILIDYIQKNLP
jgi:UDP-N-acetylglucosamine:LPS N-acetylglucosamine transferase